MFSQLLIAVTVLICFHCCCSYEKAIEKLDDCSDYDDDVVDRARISYYLPQDLLDAGGGIDLYATNSYCYHCSKSLAARGKGDKGQARCASMWTPFFYRLYLVNTTNGHEVVYETTHLFGDQGEYEVHPVFNAQVDNSGGRWGLNIHETKAPYDTYRPLWILAIVLFLVTSFAFVGPPLVQCIVDRYVDRSIRKNRNSEEKNSSINVTSPLLEESEIAATPSASSANDREEAALLGAAPEPKKPSSGTKKERLRSLDSFRGFSLIVMIFVNYGGGGYWFFEHAPWNGLTVADLLFPWFMWIMGVSMAISFNSLLAKMDRNDASCSATVSPAPASNGQQWILVPKKLFGVDSILWYRVARRSCILFLIGMFLANGYEYQTWRVPGVLQYFAVSYFVTGCTILGTHSLTRPLLQRLQQQRQQVVQGTSTIGRWLTAFGLSIEPSVLSAYRFEWLIQLLVLTIYLSIAYGGKAPGCPRGYLGPGGSSEHGNHEFCTGGIHRYIDMQVFGYDFIYHSPTCKELYSCRAYDPEGLLGSLSACSLTYLGLMAGRVVVHFKEHRQRLSRWILWGLTLLLLAGILCGFSQEDGMIPINKNLWSTSFVTVAAGGGLVLLAIFYQLIDVLKVWSGAPFFYLGMNSILVYVGHDILGGYMPFSYQVYDVNHGSLLQMNLLGTMSWVVVAAYLYRIKFFLKI